MSPIGKLIRSSSRKADRKSKGGEVEPVGRRDFLKSLAGAATVAAIEPGEAPGAGPGPVFLSTWAHVKPANERAAEVFKAVGSLLAAAEKGINVPQRYPI